MQNTIHLARERQKLFISLYKTAFPVIAKHVSRMGGSFDEAKDVFQDALVAYYEKTIRGEININNGTAYLAGTAKHLWLKRYRQNEHHIPMDNIDVEAAEAENFASNRLMHFLEKTGKKCMDLLKSFYYDETPLQEIAEEYGYSGTRSATVQKYKCLEKIRETIKQKAIVYEDFME